MKAYINRVAIILLTLSATFSCDYINEPLQGGSGPIDTGNGDVVMRNVLIEDFTGQRCNNCPLATDEIKTIKGIAGWEGRAIPIAIHSGFFAAPTAAPFDADYRTTEGAALVSFFKPGGYPTGMIGRTDFPVGHFKNFRGWPDDVAPFIPMEADLSLDISIDYNTGSREASITVDSEIFNDMVGDFNIVALLAEDSVASAQVTPTGNDLNYVHNYMLRRSTNTIWGESYIAGSAAVGANLSYTTSVTVENEWREDFCKMIVFVYETTTQEIIHVEEKKLFN